MKNNTTLYRIILLLFIINFNACKIIKPNTEIGKDRFLVQGKLTKSSQYCGGTHPSREEEWELMREKPYYTLLYVRKAKKNRESVPIFDSVTTDRTGAFEFKLPPGKYVILMPFQRNKDILKTYSKMKNKYLKINKFCMRKWWQGGLFKITISDKNILKLNYNFHFRCNVPFPIPCINYIGPNPA